MQEKERLIVRHQLCFPFLSWVESSKDQTAFYAWVAQEIGEEQKSLCTNINHNFMSIESPERWISPTCPVLLLRCFWLSSLLRICNDLKASFPFVCSYELHFVWLEVICFSQQKVALWCFSQLTGCLAISLLMRALMNNHLWLYIWTQPDSVVNFPYVWMGDSFSYQIQGISVCLTLGKIRTKIGMKNLCLGRSIAAWNFD